MNIDLLKNTWSIARLQNKQRVNRTALGYIWVFLPQILFITVATLVFTLISGQKSVSHALYVLVGMIFWVYFSEGYLPYAQQFSDGRGLFLNLKVSYLFLPITNFFRCFQIFLPLIILVSFVFILTGQINIWLTPYFILCFFLGGMASSFIPLIFSYLSLILKDFHPISVLFSQLLFFLSPIGWVHINFPPLIFLNKLNAVAVTINLLRSILNEDLETSFYLFTNLVLVGLFSLFLAVALHKIFKKQITLRI